VPADTSDATDHKIRAYLQARLRVTPYIKYIDTETIQRVQFPENSRKPVKLIDKRAGSTKT
jgi:phenylacetate-CoA ligase